MTIKSSKSAKELQQLREEQEKMLFKNSIVPFYLSLLAAVFLCWYLRHSVSTSTISKWLIAFSCITFLRIFLLRIPVSLPQRTFFVNNRYLFYVIGTNLAGCSWGVASFLLFPEFDSLAQTGFTIIIIGIGAASITTLCPSWAAVSGFLSLCLLPLSGKLFTMSGEHGLILGTLAFFFWVVSLLGAHKLHTNIAENISLRLQSTSNEKALAIGKERFRHIFHNSPLGIVHFDNKAIILDSNKVFAEIVGLTEAEIKGKKLPELISGKTFAESLQAALSFGEGFFEGDYQSSNEAAPIPLRVVFKATRSADKTVSGGIGSFENPLEKRAFEEKLKRQANYDLLTGLPNRRFLLGQVEKELSRARRYKQHGALFFVDLDNFRTINDSLGHSAGDMLLKQVGARLLSQLRKEDILGHLGGDEFALLLPNLAEEVDVGVQKAQQIAEKVGKLLSEPFDIENQVVIITPSIGISTFPENEKAADDILQQANTAMNQGKGRGRNNISFFHPEMQSAAEKKFRLNSDIRRAIDNEELSLHFQPQVKADGSIIGAEALIRWNHPERGMIPPGDFIATAEETGIIVDLGRWVLNQVCLTIKKWEECDFLKNKQTIAVNISAKEFSTPDFTERVINTVVKSGISPHHLDIELTEGSLLTSVSDTIEKITILREYGIRFSVDDFGTGYSSLSYLKSLPLHTLKLDRSFVNDIKDHWTDEEEIIIAEIIISMALKLGLEIVAEGVENSSQLEYLVSKQCPFFQGYYFCKPLPLDEFEKLLQQGRIT